MSDFCRFRLFSRAIASPSERFSPFSLIPPGDSIAVLPKMAESGNEAMLRHRYVTKNKRKR